MILLRTGSLKSKSKYSNASDELSPHWLLTAGRAKILIANLIFPEHRWAYHSMLSCYQLHFMSGSNTMLYGLQTYKCHVSKEMIWCFPSISEKFLLPQTIHWSCCIIFPKQWCGWKIGLVGQATSWFVNEVHHLKKEQRWIIGWGSIIWPYAS